MVNSTRAVSPPALLGLDAAATEKLKALFAETAPLAGANSIPDLSNPGQGEQSPATLPWYHWLFRGVLGTGAIVLTMTTGLLAGAILAQRAPQFSPLLSPGPTIAAATEPPVLEQVFQGMRQEGKRLPIYWQSWFSKPSTPLNIDPAALSQWEAGALEAKLDRLVSSSQSLEAEVSDLENQLGISTIQSKDPLSQRLQSLRQALVAPAGSPSSLPLQITLPTDLLFADGQTTLKPEAADLLQNLENSLQTEIPQRRSLNITIATHTDAVGHANRNLDLSFQRSRALQGYLAQHLNAADLTWNAVGYGATHPVADNSIASNRQRNRRVEITLGY
ncbi:MAG: OmpA family protein [Prochlorotrichaceae cyanobacterium]|jgi:outer membrane protein OmpA-like peptidoglycan-associated protein